MKSITLLEGIAAAILLACIGVAANFMLQFLFDGLPAAKANIALLALLYLGYLFYKSGIRSGKVILSAGSLIILLAAVFFIKTLGGVLIAAAVLIWIMRSALYASGLLPAFAHLALCLLGVALAGYAAMTGSGIAAAVWCFFLTQALWIFIPSRAVNRSPAPESAAEANRFNRAYTTADAAIKRLIDATDR